MSYAWTPSAGLHLAFVADGALVVSGQYPEKVERFEAPGFDTPVVSVDLADLTCALAAAPGSEEVFLGMKTAVLLDARTLKKRKVSLKGHRYELGAIAWAPSGDVVFTGGGGRVQPLDDTLRASGKDGSERAVILGVGAPVMQIAAFDDTFVVARDGAGIGGYDFVRRERVWRWPSPESRPHGPIARWGGELVCALSTEDPSAWVALVRLDARTGVELARIPLFHVSDAGHVDGLVVRGDWAALSMGQNQGEPARRKTCVRWIHLPSGLRGPVLEADEQTGTLALSQDGRWLAARMRDLGIAVFDLDELRAELQ